MTDLTHHDDCWREHLDCAIARVVALDRQLARTLADRRRGVESRKLGCGHMAFWATGGERWVGEHCYRCLYVRNERLLRRVEALEAGIKDVLERLRPRKGKARAL